MKKDVLATLYKVSTTVAAAAGAITKKDEELLEKERAAGALMKRILDIKDTSSKRIIAAQRQLAAADSLVRSMFRAVDGDCWEILSQHRRGDATSGEDFVDRLYYAMTQTSIRKWARKHVAVLWSVRDEIDGTSRKIKKLEERIQADPSSTESVVARSKLADARKTKAALEHRMSFTARKFLELRRCVLKSLVGASETILDAAGRYVVAEDIDKHSYDMRADLASLEAADAKARRRAVK